MAAPFRSAAAVRFSSRAAGAAAAAWHFGGDGARAWHVYEADGLLHP
jgi:hypothetical protein